MSPLSPWGDDALLPSECWRVDSASLTKANPQRARLRSASRLTVSRRHKGLRAVDAAALVILSRLLRDCELPQRPLYARMARTTQARESLIALTISPAVTPQMPGAK
jgi:hypothetical protein